MGTKLLLKKLYKTNNFQTVIISIKTKVCRLHVEGKMGQDSGLWTPAAQHASHQLLRAFMVFYLLSWEIFIIVTTQTYFCDLLNISALFLKQSWKHFLPDLIPASLPTHCWWRHRDSSRGTNQTSLVFSSWEGVFWEHYIVTAVHFSHSRWGTCPVWMGKASCSTIIYNMGKWGMLSTKFRPRAYTHTHTLQIF